MKFKCLDVGNLPELFTEDKVYETQRIDSDGDHRILTDNGNRTWCIYSQYLGNTGSFNVDGAVFEIVAEHATYIAKIKELLAKLEEERDVEVRGTLNHELKRLDIMEQTLVEELETMWDLRNIFQPLGWSTNQIKSFANWLHESDLSGCEVRELVDGGWKDIMQNDMDDVESAIELWDSLDREQRDFIGENSIDEIMGMVESYKRICRICSD